MERMQEIERMEAEAEAARESEGAAGPTLYFLQAGLFTDEDEAVEILTSLVDLGFDGALISGARGGRLLYEVRVGPYEDIEEARKAGRVLERSEGLSPSILIEAPEEP
jgi:cell division protein FtsN